MNGSHRYAICGYATVYLYYAYPNKTRPRISQFLILPTFQRIGLGSNLLNVINQSFYKNDNILDITGKLLYIPSHLRFGFCFSYVLFMFML